MGKLLKIAERVGTILLDNPRARDDDALLLKLMLDCYYQKSHTLTVWRLVVDIQNDDFPAIESIRRTRQKLQEKYPHLRGNSYRHRLQRQNEIIEEIKELDKKEFDFFK